MQLTVRNKLFSSFGVILAILVGLGIYAYIGAGKINKQASELNNMWLLGVDAAHTIETLGYQYRTKEYRYMASASTLSPHEDFSVLVQDMKKLEEDIDKAIKAYRNAATLPEDIKNCENVKDIWDNYLQKSREVIELAREKKFQEGMELILKGDSMQSFNDLRSATSALVKYNQEHGAMANEKSQQTYNLLKVMLILYITVPLFIGALMAWYISTSISRSINNILDVSEKVADGDLTKRVNIKSEDELGKLAAAFNSMIERLRELVFKISESSHGLAVSSQQLTSSSEQSSKVMEQIAIGTQTVASSADNQLSSVKEVFDSISQVSSGLNQISASSQGVTRLAQESASASDKGIFTVSAVAKHMKEIDNTISDTAKVIKSLSKKSAEIGKIVEMITDITDQTNLLSLNATIEAARAGEAGKGFAVVADEVKKLSEQSKMSASQIKDLLSNICEETNNAVISISIGTEKVSEGIEKSELVNQAFQEIRESIQSVGIKIREVSSATEHISAESQNIVKSIDVVEKSAEQVNNASQENAVATQEQLATMEEISSNAQSLSDSAEDLNRLISQFKVK
ncbi:MAG TPA: methyl-accepting chemotaxis protein [Ruminiclostridium sp.]|nr:methyl-accepting chemotaxis protein [Ruminiclostridium sp.]